LYSYVNLIDCFIIDKSEQKVFIYEGKLSLMDFYQIKDTEPKKHGPWKLYSIKEALKLPLMPYIEDYLKKI